jgi:hypothetical protein
MKTKSSHPIRLVYVALAIPADLSFEESGLMDHLSDLRDNTEGVKLLEWAQAPCPQTGKREGIVIDGETPEMHELFDSCYVSPRLKAEEEALDGISPEFLALARALSTMPEKPDDWNTGNPDAVAAYDEALSLWRFQCCELAGLRANG